MGIVVQKYGGSSVRDVEHLKGVARRIKKTCEDGHRVVAVVSAMGKGTDGLIDLAKQVSQKPGRRELDMLVSVGERISMTLLSMAVNDLGLEAISFTGSQSGIITDTSHFNARILEVRPGRIQRALERNKVVIVAGYQGVSLDKEVTTLGRGGTDTTAVALAAALGADYCEICSDVDGVYSADPRLIEEAAHIDTLSHDEMLALSRGGARVLAAEAVAYAKATGIEIHAASTFNAGRYTRITVDEPSEKPIAVTGNTNIELMLWRGAFEESARFLAYLGHMAIEPIDLRTFSGIDRRKMEVEQHIHVRFSTVSVPDLEGLRHEALSLFEGSLFFEQDEGSVTLVGFASGGDGASSATRVMADALNCLLENDILVFGSSFSGVSMTFNTPKRDVDKAQTCLHRHFLVKS